MFPPRIRSQQLLLWTNYRLPFNTPQSIKTHTKKETDLSKDVIFWAEDLLFKHSSPIFACRGHIQTIHASRSVTCVGWRHTLRGCERLSHRFLADIPHLPLHSPLEESTVYTSYSRLRLWVAAASALQTRAASSSGDGDQLSCRRLDRSVFMAAAGRDVSLAPSIQLPSDGFSPCFIIIPIISRGGGSRLPPSCLRSPSH